MLCSLLPAQCPVHRRHQHTQSQKHRNEPGHPSPAATRPGQWDSCEGWGPAPAPRAPCLRAYTFCFQLVYKKRAQDSFKGHQVPSQVIIWEQGVISQELRGLSA